jgi:hypothetical protein
MLRLTEVEERRQPKGIFFEPSVVVGEVTSSTVFLSSDRIAKGELSLFDLLDEKEGREGLGDPKSIGALIS